jgi:hypothetical protein
VNRRLSLLAVLLLAAGCGRKLAPVPPVEVVPVRTELLKISQEGSDAVLRFPIPKKTTTGEPLDTLFAVNIYREMLPASAGAFPPPPPEGEMRGREEKNFRLRAELIQKLSQTEIDQVFFGGELIVRDSLTSLFEQKRLGRVFVRYAVTALMARNRESQLSPITALKPLLPHREPGPLYATVVERGVCLDWSAPEEMLDGEKAGPVEAYLLYRRDAAGDGVYEEPLGVIKKETTYLDPMREAGKLYFYTVRAAANESSPYVLGPPAMEILVPVTDAFPPAAPTGLQLLQEPEGIRLVWNPVGALDLDSYRVYRKDPVTGNTRLVAGSLLDTTYFDKGSTSTVGYYVTAIDKSGNESQRVEEILPVKVEP